MAYKGGAVRNIIIYLFLILIFICSCSGKNNTASDWIEKENALWDGRQYADPQKAIEYLNNAIKLQQNNVTAYNKRGNAYTQLGQYQRAIEDYNQAIVLNPDNITAYNNRGNAYTELGQYQRSIEDYNRAIVLKPNDVYAYYNKACCFALQKQGKQACESLSLAIKRGFNNWTYLKEDKDFENIKNTACFINLFNKSVK
jgi:tetratricopeptide (TPR) repeat protein